MRSQAEAERLLAKRHVTEDGCWEWTAARNTYGYGVTSRTLGPGVRRTTLTHRLSYEVFVGPIPEGLQLDHLCRNRACFNPEHLEPVTLAENVRRGARMTSPTCAKGHDKGGHSVCPVCTGEWFITHYEERRAYHRAYYAIGRAERRRRKECGLPVVTPDEIAEQLLRGAAA